MNSIIMEIHNFLVLFFMHEWPVCSTLDGSCYMWFEQPGRWLTFEGFQLVMVDWVQQSTVMA